MSGNENQVDQSQKTVLSLPFFPSQYGYYSYNLMAKVLRTMPRLAARRRCHQHRSTRKKKET